MMLLLKRLVRYPSDMESRLRLTRSTVGLYEICKSLPWLTVFLSVSDAQQIQDALKKVLDDFGKIDVYVANAGMISVTMSSI
jgi:NADP-dependent 3-hydroxy acid dehydrogenase YdfG